jgi:hypothetical protein
MIISLDRSVKKLTSPSTTTFLLILRFAMPRAVLRSNRLCEMAVAEERPGA